MKTKIISLLFAIMIVNGLSAQTYTVISRNNVDTIKLYPNILGEAIKTVTNMLPGAKDVSYYCLIKKEYNGQESLLFVELSLDEKKILTAYETDLITAGKWQTKIYTLYDIYTHLKRENAIYLHGNIIGLEIEIHQRPANFQDRIIIDGIEFPAPIKMVALDETRKLVAEKEAQRLEKERIDAEKVAEKEAQRLEKERIEAEKAAAMNEKIKEQENAIKKLAAKEENKAYIAYLLKTSQTDMAHSAEIAKYFVNEEIMALINNKSAEELKVMSANHDKYFERFKGYNRY